MKTSAGGSLASFSSSSTALQDEYNSFVTLIKSIKLSPNEDDNQLSAGLDRTLDSGALLRHRSSSFRRMIVS